MPPAPVKDRPDRLAGSAYDAAYRPHGPPGVGLRLHRLLRMNDDLTTLAIMGVVAIVGVRIVGVRVVILRRSWSGDGECQRRHPGCRYG